MKSFRKTYAILALSVFLILPVITQAETVLRKDKTVSIAENQIVESDFYAVAETVTMSGVVEGDMYAIGGSVTTNGSVEEDVSILAGAAQIHASTSDDVRVVAGEVVVADHVGGDLFVLGGRLEVLSTAEIVGDVFFYGGEAVINGPVGGSIYGGAESIRVDSQVAKDIDVAVASLTLGNQASIGGNVTYRSQHEPVRAQGAVVEGEVVKNTAVVGSVEGSNWRDSLTRLIVTAFAVLSLYLVFVRSLRSFAKETITAPARSLLLGCAGLFGLPIAVLILLLTVIGAVVGVVGLLAYLVLLLVGYIMLHILTGAALAYVFTKQITVNLTWVLLGILTVSVVWSIPFIGPFLIFIGLLFSLGGLMYMLYRLVP